MNQFFIKTCIIATTALLMPHTVLGASMSFQPATLAAPQSNPYTVTVLIDTQGESINTLEGVVVVDSALGDEVTVTDSGSIATYWVKQPTWDKATRTVAFSGAVPGGYSGGSGIIFSLVLPAYSGTGVTNAIKLSSVRVYRNDGLGTQAQVSVKSFTIGNSNAAVDKSVQEQLYIGDEKKDNIPPEVFSPQLSQDDRVFDGKWFINFSTVDKQSGIDHYEIQETRSGTIEGGKWKPVTSPYLLEDQELHSFIYVIAIDRQGNERVIKVFPRRPLSWTQQYGNTLVAVGVGVIIVLLSYDIIRRRRVPQSIIR